MPDRSPHVVNFSAGPGVLPVSVLEQVQADLVSLPGVGVSALEISHRSAWFEGVIEEAEANLRALLGIADGHACCSARGARRMQFSMVPMNLLRGNRPSGRLRDHRLVGRQGGPRRRRRKATPRVAWTATDEGFVRVPRTDELALLSDDPAYVHITTNETIQGVEFCRRTALPDVPLVADMSSDFLSRPVDISQLRRAVRRRAEERRPGRRHGRDRARRPARARPGRSADDARLPHVRRERLAVQHAAGVRDLRPDARDPLAPRRDRRTRADGGRATARRPRCCTTRSTSSGGFYRGHAEATSRSR